MYSYTLVSERVFECSVIDDVFCGSELDYFRASTPPIADIGDRNTFLRRSLQPMAIGAHVHVREHGPTQVDFNCFACSHGCCTRLADSIVMYPRGSAAVCGVNVVSRIVVVSLLSLIHI